MLSPELLWGCAACFMAGMAVGAYLMGAYLTEDL